MQAGDAIGVAAADLLAVGALHLVRRGTSRQPQERGGLGLGAGHRDLGGRGRGRRRRRGAHAAAAGAIGRDPRALLDQGGPLGGEALALLGHLARQRDQAPVAGGRVLAQRREHGLGVGVLGSVIGHAPAGTGLSAAHRGHDLAEGGVGAISQRRPLGRGQPHQPQGVPARLGQERRRRAPAQHHPALRAGPVAQQGEARRHRGRRRAAPRAPPPGPRAAGPPRARPAPRPAPGRRGRARSSRPSAPADCPAASTRHHRAQGSSGGAVRRAAAAASGWSSDSSAAASPAEAGRSRPGRRRPRGARPGASGSPSRRAGAGPAAAMKGSGIGSTVAVRGSMLGRDEPARRRVIPLPAASTPTTRSTGTPGARRRWPGPGPRTGRCSCRSATRPATGAT